MSYRTERLLRPYTPINTFRSLIYSQSVVVVLGFITAHINNEYFELYPVIMSFFDLEIVLEVQAPLTTHS